MGNVFSIGGATPPGQPVEDIVELLERLLEEAKAGDIRGIAYAISLNNGCKATGWEEADGSRDPLCTAIGILQHRYLAGLLDD